MRTSYRIPRQISAAPHMNRRSMVRHRLLMYITDLEELLASNFLAMCYFLFKGVFLGIDSVGATNFCNNNRRLAGCILTEEKKKMQTTNGRRKLGMPFMLCTLELLLCRVFCIFLSMDAFRGECALWKQCINKIMCTVCTCLPLIHRGWTITRSAGKVVVISAYNQFS